MNNQNVNSNPNNCGSPNKYQGNNTVNNLGNSYNNENAGNAQNDIGFDASYGLTNAEGTAGKKWMCRNCGTMHYGQEAPKSCGKCDSCNFKEM